MIENGNQLYQSYEALACSEADLTKLAELCWQLMAGLIMLEALGIKILRGSVVATSAFNFTWKSLVVLGYHGLDKMEMPESKPLDYGSGEVMAHQLLPILINYIVSAMDSIKDFQYALGLPDKIFPALLMVSAMSNVVWGGVFLLGKEKEALALLDKIPLPRIRKKYVS